MIKISILDYGMGNIESLKNAIKKIGYHPTLFSAKKNINSNFLIIPGVGAFNEAMKIIKKERIDKKINSFLNNKDNFLLGICLGKQLLYTSSEENKLTYGLNIIKGKVKLVAKKKEDKIPNVGWHKIKINNNNLKNFKFLKEFNGEKFYFVHSYKGEPTDKKTILATSSFKKKKFCSVVCKGKNIIGTQFHPEKSSFIGLDFLKTVISNYN